MSKPLNFNPGPGSYIISQESKKKMMKSRLSDNSWLLGESDSKSLVNQSVIDDNMSRKSKEKIIFNTIDYSESFNKMKANPLMRKVQKNQK